MKKNGLVGLAVMTLVACVLSEQPSYAKDNRVSVGDGSPRITSYLPYSIVQSNAELHDKFVAYLRWIVGLDGEASDAAFTLAQMGLANQTLDSLSTAYHEKVEFLHWLELGHAPSDVMTVEYYQRNYPRVYPVAHRRAMAAELNLIRFFAKTHTIPTAPGLAYILVHPMREKRKMEGATIPIQFMAYRVTSNLEYQIESVAENDLKNAIQTFKAGGYVYEDEQRILKEAAEFRCDERCWCEAVRRWQRNGYEFDPKMFGSCLDPKG